MSDNKDPENDKPIKETPHVQPKEPDPRQGKSPPKA